MISKNQIKRIQSLHRKKERDELRLFLVEGVKTIRELLMLRPELVKEVFATEDFINDNLALLKKADIAFNAVIERELEQISSMTTPNKVIAICSYFNESKGGFDFKKNFTLYLDDIRDPGNLGTIIRLADWYGISEIYCSLTSCELYNPKVIQSTMGAFMRVKVTYISLAELVTVNEIKSVYGAVLNGKDVYKEQLNNGLIIIGNEGSGINKENLKLINRPITIPSHEGSGTESLNAAMATAIITSEFFRQLQH